jgi:hypothetical protein
MSGMRQIVGRLKEIDGTRLIDWSMFGFGAGSLALALVLTAATLVTADTAGTRPEAPAAVQQN